MKLIRATDDFKILGEPYEDFPLIVNAEMELVRVVHVFLIHYCITRGRVNSKHSWWRYGQDMYDYFGFLESRNLDWRSSMATTQHSVIAVYRDFSVNIGLSNKTINSRLRTIIQFYEFALREDWIDSVPFDIEVVVINKPKEFFAHTDRSGNIKATPDVLLKEKAKQIKLLSKQEITKLLYYKTSISHQLFYRLALQTGMRRAEILSFPESYIQNPLQHKGSAMVPITLNSRDMVVISGINLEKDKGGTKGDKERTIHIPFTLYENLWFYKTDERHKLLQKNEIPNQKALLLNRYGQPYSMKASILVNTLKEAVGRQDVCIHQLRHTYATHKLYELKNTPNYRGDALVYIQDRLGHSSINTTMIYLHYIEELEGNLMTKYEQDIDSISLNCGEYNEQA
jgi:site-specific recombinase XerD